MKKIIFVTKDLAPAQFATPIAQALAATKNAVSVIAEDLSADVWKETRFQPIKKGPIYQTGNETPIEAEAIIASLKPDIVITGLSSPIHWEEIFGIAANRLHIPVGFIEDLEGARVRSRAQPSLIITINETAATLAAARDRNRRIPIIVAGDFMLDRARTSALSAEFTALFASWQKQHEFSILFLGHGGEYNTELLSILLDSLAMTKKDFFLIPKLHPKAERSLPKIWERWQTMIKNFADSSGRVLATDTHSHKLATLADMTVSGFGSGIRVAAYSGKFPVAIETAGVKQKYLAETGLSRDLTAKLGAAASIAAPCDLGELYDHTRNIILKNQQKLPPPAPFNPLKTAREIIAALG